MPCCTVGYSFPQALQVVTAGRMLHLSSQPRRTSSLSDIHHDGVHVLHTVLLCRLLDVTDNIEHNSQFVHPISS